MIDWVRDAGRPVLPPGAITTHLGSKHGKQICVGPVVRTARFSESTCGTMWLSGAGQQDSQRVAVQKYSPRVNAEWLRGAVVDLSLTERTVDQHVVVEVHGEADVHTAP